MPTHRSDDRRPEAPRWPYEQTARRERHEVQPSGAGVSGDVPEADPAADLEAIGNEAAGHSGESLERERTSEPDARRTHLGWQILDRDGDWIGEVVERDDASILVVGEIPGQSTARIPLRLVDEESIDNGRATLVLSKDEVADLQELSDR